MLATRRETAPLYTAKQWLARWCPDDMPKRECARRLMQSAGLEGDDGEGPSGARFASRSVLAHTLNAIDHFRVTLSLR